MDFSAPLSNDFEAVIPAAEADAACERAFTTLTALHAGAAGSTSAQLKAVSGLCALGSIAVREAKTLPWILEGSTVRMQDKPSALASFASGKGEAVLWRFITSNWAAFYARFQVRAATPKNNRCCSLYCVSTFQCTVSIDGFYDLDLILHPSRISLIVPCLSIFVIFVALSIRTQTGRLPDWPAHDRDVRVD